MPIVNDGSGDADGLVRAGKAAALGELTAGFAHELNNPLFAILGLVDFLLAEAEAGSRTQRRLTVVRDTALEMREAVRTLLAFAREPADVRGRVAFAEAVEQTVELVRRTSSTRDVELVVTLPEAPVHVEGSRGELRLALLHLLANACAAMPGGGTLRISLEHRQGWASLVVADSGPGVAPELRDRIFDPFFSTRPEGNGLGLAASRTVAERHGGTLELAPGDGGATFVLRLPAIAAEAA